MYNEKLSFFNRGLKVAGFAILGISAALFFAAVFAIAVKFLWNWLMPEIFGLTAISFMQAFGLILLARLLVGGWHSNHGHNSNRSKKHDHLHKFFEREFSGIPEEIRLNKKGFMMFWEEEGNSRFRDYLKKNEDGKE